jgi:hypothetical protein
MGRGRRMMATAKDKDRRTSKEKMVGEREWVGSSTGQHNIPVTSHPLYHHLVGAGPRLYPFHSAHCNYLSSLSIHACC